MSTYEELLEEARTKVQTFQQSTAKEYVLKMYRILRAENPELSPVDARYRIGKDCVGIWSKRTVLEYLPDEAKDIKKQKAGQLRQKKTDSAALAAAPESKQILLDVQGRETDDSMLQSETTVGSPRKQFKDQTIVKLSDGVTRPNRRITPVISECQNCLGSALKIRELELALRETTQLKKASEIYGCHIENNISQQEDNNVMMPFEFWLLLEDVRRHILTTFNLNKSKDKLWFNGTFNRQTGRVVAANIGRIVSQREQKALQGEQE
jgi:hypothetical protein